MKNEYNFNRMKLILKSIAFIIIFSLSFTPAYSFGKKEKEGNGYVGKLPNIEKTFGHKKYKIQSNPETNLIQAPIEKNNLIEGPMEDAVFVDVIIKKQKPSKYVDDIMKIIPVAEKLRTITKENGSNIQKYNSGVNNFDLYVTKLQKDYQDKPESISESYILLQDVNYRAKVLGNLKYEANFYSKYKPVLEEEYTPQYLQEHDEILVKELDKLIFILQQESENAQYGKINKDIPLIP